MTKREMNNALFDALFPKQFEITEKDLLTETINDMLIEEQIRSKYRDIDLRLINFTKYNDEKNI